MRAKSTKNTKNRLTSRCRWRPRNLECCRHTRGALQRNMGDYVVHDCVVHVKGLYQIGGECRMGRGMQRNTHAQRMAGTPMYGFKTDACWLTRYHSIFYICKFRWQQERPVGYRTFLTRANFAGNESSVVYVLSHIAPAMFTDKTRKIENNKSNNNNKNKRQRNKPYKLNHPICYYVVAGK